MRQFLRFARIAEGQDAIAVVDHAEVAVQRVHRVEQATLVAPVLVSVAAIFWPILPDLPSR